MKAVLFLTVQICNEKMLLQITNSITLPYTVVPHLWRRTLLLLEDDVRLHNVVQSHLPAANSNSVSSDH